MDQCGYAFLLALITISCKVIWSCFQIFWSTDLGFMPEQNSEINQNTLSSKITTMNDDDSTSLKTPTKQKRKPYIYLLEFQLPTNCPLSGLKMKKCYIHWIQILSLPLQPNPYFTEEGSGTMCWYFHPKLLNSSNVSILLISNYIIVNK